MVAFASEICICINMSFSFPFCSVLVHSGGVHGGHYYAFIRPTLSDQWYASYTIRFFANNCVCTCIFCIQKLEIPSQSLGLIFVILMS